jgi:hypothetical protein
MRHPPQRADSGPSRQSAAVAKDRLDDWLDRALEDTFPASDPIGSPPGGTAGAAEDLATSWPDSSAVRDAPGSTALRQRRSRRTS